MTKYARGLPALGSGLGYTVGSESLAYTGVGSNIKDLSVVMKYICI
jgi:hypothetical protein